MTKPFMFTLFGSTGDLAQKKIMPALFTLFREGRLPQEFTIIAFSRRAWTDDQYRAFIKPYLQHLKDAHEKLDAFLDHVVYAEGHFTEAASFNKLKDRIELEKNKFGSVQQLFYFAVQPEFYEQIIKNADAAGILCKETKLLIEKPFGHSVASAEALEALLCKHIKDSQIYRVDHYLAKGGVEDLIVLRSQNKEFENKLNAKHVEKIDVTFFEILDIQGRGDFYEKTGALVDVGQNHELQMLATAMMDITHPDRNVARAEVIESLKIVGEPKLGQYEGYREEEGVHQDSHTETYFKLNLESKLEQWKGIPISFAGGKAMAKKDSSVTFTFTDGTIYKADMNKQVRDAYEIVIEEALLDNKAYFASLREIIAAWKLLEPIFTKRDTLELVNYSKGTNPENL